MKQIEQILKHQNIMKIEERRHISFRNSKKNVEQLFQLNEFTLETVDHAVKDKKNECAIQQKKQL